MALISIILLENVAKMPNYKFLRLALFKLQ